MFLFGSLLFRGQGCHLQQFLSVMPPKCLTDNLANPTYSSLMSAAKLGSGITLGVHE